LDLQLKPWQGKEEMGWEQAKAKTKALTSLVGNGKEAFLGHLG
jgi:hypothetical protein